MLLEERKYSMSWQRPVHGIMGLGSGLRTKMSGAGIAYTLLKGIEAIGFPTFGLLL